MPTFESNNNKTMMKKITLLAAMALSMSLAFGQTPKTITQLRANDAIGVPLDTITRISTTGVVYGPNSNKFKSSGGLTFILNDHSYGIKVYSTRSFGYSLTDGDSVYVVGTVKFFRGGAELTTSAGDTIIKLGTGVKDAPMVVTKLDSERYEGTLIRLNGVDMNTVVSGSSFGQWGPSGTFSSFSAFFNPGQKNNVIFIDSNVNSTLFFWSKPSGIYDIVGFGAQFTSKTAVTQLGSGYQIIPRDTNDFIKKTNVGVNEITKDVLAAYVYPNPTSSNINVYMSFDKSEVITAHVYDLSGREVATNSYDMTKGDNTVSINTNNINTGLYILSVTSASGKSMSTKVNIIK
jgi:hypothetical protein